MRVFIPKEFNNRYVVNHQQMRQPWAQVCNDIVFNFFGEIDPEELFTYPGYMWKLYDKDIELVTSYEEAELICFSIGEIYRTTKEHWKKVPSQISKAMELENIKQIIIIEPEYTYRESHDRLMQFDYLLFKEFGKTDKLKYYINSILDYDFLNYEVFKFSPYMFNWNIKERFVPNNLVGSFNEHLEQKKEKIFLSYCHHSSAFQKSLHYFIRTNKLEDKVYFSNMEDGVFLDYTQEEYDLHTPWQFNLQNKKHYTNSYFSVVRETINLAITEKTWKPIINFHPFIFNTSDDNFYIKTLEDMGFRTFDKYFDGSNCKDRIRSWLTDIEDKDKWFLDLKDDLIYNRERLVNFTMKDIL